MQEKGIRLGILFSLTGCTAITEVGQYRSALLAIEQINRKGGVDGLPLIPIAKDIASDPLLAKQKATELIVKNKIHVIIGPYTSACRKAVIPVLKRYNILMFYPTLYEGNEQNDWIYYTGALPNQQLQFFIPWILSNLGHSFFLVGSDYIFPRVTNKHMHELLTINGGIAVDESYASLGTQNFDYMLDEISKKKPDVVFSTLVGDSAVSFYQQYYRAGFEQPICSPITAETEINAMNNQYCKNLFSSFPYFKTVESKENQTFIQAYEQKFGSKVISSVMQNTYNSIYLLMDGIHRAGSLDTDSIRRALNHSSYDAPQGSIKFDDNNHHLWQKSRIGQVTERGDFKIVWESQSAIAPTPFISHASSLSPSQYVYFKKEDADKRKKTISIEQLSSRRHRWQRYMAFFKQLPQFFDYQFLILDPDCIVVERIDKRNPCWSNKGIELGSKWTVDVKGKNGFGMALQFKKPYIVQGDQHDDEKFKESITVGLPILKNDEFIGFLGIIASIDSFSEVSSHINTFEMFIHSFIKYMESQNNIILFNNALKRETDHIAEGFIMVRDSNILFKNVFADYLINKKPSLIYPLLDNIDQLLDSTMEQHMRRKVDNEIFDIDFQRHLDSNIIHIRPLASKDTSNQDPQNTNFQDIIGMNRNFIKTINIAQTAAQADANVLIIGESGTGKELFANAIHNESKRHGKPFVAVNCGAISRDLIYSEFFGYEEGAFTGARKGGKQGLFETASGGTVFLDEIGEMPLDLQATLLRVLQEKTVTRIGSYKPIPIDVRIIAATNKNIIDEIAYKGNFRKDLYYRLSVFQLELIPLRERTSDIPELAETFLVKLNEKHHTDKKFSGKALKLLQSYHWPGNVRELENVVERCYYLSHFDSVIEPETIKSYYDFTPSLNQDSSIEDEEKVVVNHAGYEREVILNCLKKTGSNVSLTAKKLNISRTTLYKKMRVYHIEIKRHS